MRISDEFKVAGQLNSSRGNLVHKSTISRYLLEWELWLQTPNSGSAGCALYNTAQRSISKDMLEIKEPFLESTDIGRLKTITTNFFILTIVSLRIHLTTMRSRETNIFVTALNKLSGRCVLLCENYEACQLVACIDVSF